MDSLEEKPACEGAPYLRSQRQQRLDGLVRRNERHELGVDQLDLVNLGTDEVGVQLVSNCLSIAGGGSLTKSKRTCQANIRRVTMVQSTTSAAAAAAAGNTAYRQSSLLRNGAYRQTGHTGPSGA